MYMSGKGLRGSFPNLHIGRTETQGSTERVVTHMCFEVLRIKESQQGCDKYAADIYGRVPSFTAAGSIV